jgi:hypothetical protein
MNGRLTKEEISENARARWRRNRVQKKRKRREGALRTVLDFVGFVELMTPDQAFVLAFGDLHQGRRLARFLEGIIGATAEKKLACGGHRASLPAHNRPTRILRPKSRAAVIPRLVQECLSIDPVLEVPQALGV